MSPKVVWFQSLSLVLRDLSFCYTMAILDFPVGCIHQLLMESIKDGWDSWNFSNMKGRWGRSLVLYQFRSIGQWYEPAARRTDEDIRPPVCKRSSDIKNRSNIFAMWWIPPLQLFQVKQRVECWRSTNLQPFMSSLKRRSSMEITFSPPFFP